MRFKKISFFKGLNHIVFALYFVVKYSISSNILFYGVKIWGKWNNKKLYNLVNFNPKYDYDKIAPEIPLSPIKKLTPDQLEKKRVINNKNRNSRRANEDMSTIKLMNIRINKVFDTFFINKDLFLVNFTKRYFDKTRDSRFQNMKTLMISF